MAIWRCPRGDKHGKVIYYGAYKNDPILGPSLTPAQILALPHDDVEDVEDPAGGPVGVEDAVEDCMWGQGGGEVVCVGGG